MYGVAAPATRRPKPAAPKADARRTMRDEYSQAGTRVAFGMGMALRGGRPSPSAGGAQRLKNYALRVAGRGSLADLVSQW